MKPSRNRNVPTSPSYNNNNNNNNNVSRKYNDRVIVNEVHHSLTARSVSKSFREGLRNYTQMKSSRLEPVPDDVTRYTMTSSRLEPVPDDVTPYTMTSSRLEPVPDDDTRFSSQDMIAQRDTSSPEHLGIPSSPASIPTRSHYTYPVPGDTSDDSMGAE
ncbi:hypothetical protein Avbf_13836 [Armadillidium vulgare]|nr:hypothetical protein Avbf_13836 [Armadillidium vulgare]